MQMPGNGARALRPIRNLAAIAADQFDMKKNAGN
jgi:hypothetical protein